MDNLTNIVLQMLEGTQVTLEIFFVTLILSLPLGLLAALGRISKFKPLSRFIEFLHLADAGHAADVAAFICLLRTADGGDNAAGYRGGAPRLYAKLRRLFCRNFPGGHTGGADWPV